MTSSVLEASAGAAIPRLPVCCYLHSMSLQSILYLGSTRNESPVPR